MMKIDPLDMDPIDPGTKLTSSHHNDAIFQTTIAFLWLVS